jgi:hypothetical protein
MKTILKPFIFVIRLLFQILKAGTMFLFCCALFCLALYCAYHILLWYTGDGMELVSGIADGYIEIADKGMVEAAKLGNDLNWYMYYAFKGFVLFCALFYLIPGIIIIGAMFVLSEETNVVNVRVVNYR